MNLTIIPVRTPEQIQQVRDLFQEYARWLAVDLCFQNFEKELRTLPGDYQPPEGELFLALDGNNPSGCIGLRRFSPGVGELKRLFVRPAYRRTGLGRNLLQRALEQARLTGYQELCLDTLAHMTPAISLYQSAGFVPTEPYGYNPLPDARYFRLRLK